MSTPTLEKARPALRLEKRPDGVAMLTFDQPDSQVNVLNSAFSELFKKLVDEVESDQMVRACVLASAKDSWIAGADLHQVAAVTDPTILETMIRDFHAQLDRIASSRKPYVAAIHGAALGGGLEVALACHYRIGSDDAKTVLGLPELMLGLIPAGGGCQRLPRLIGISKALPAILMSQRFRAKQAYRMGLLDALTTPKGIAETAAKAALKLSDGTLRPRRELGLLDKILAMPPFLGILIGQARAQTLKKTHGNYPAPLAAIDAIEAGLARGYKAGQAAEIKAFGCVGSGPVSKNLIFIFDAMNELKKLPDEPKPRTVRKLAVIGAGFMGEGVASVSLPIGSVVVKDVTNDMLARMAKNIRKSLDARLGKALTRLERDRQWARLSGTTEPDGIKGADLVIEAVFEKLELKKQVLAEAERAIAPDAVFASNTSALPIAEIAEGAQHPERVLGMHYFSPVPKMPLLEIIVHPGTADWALQTARAYGQAQGKTCIVVKDGPGFYTTRILAPYMNEAMVLLEEGAAIEALDKALLDFGFPVGPIALLDEVGIDVGAHIARDLGKAFGHRGLGGSGAILKVSEAGYSGRKNSRGFYRYDTKKKTVNEAVYTFFGGPARKKLPAKEMAERLALLLANEAVHCLQEGILASARDGDMGAILGLGFPPFLGGPFHHLDTLGAKAVVDRMQQYEQRLGPRFTPAPLLAEMARDGKRFYSS